MIAKQYRFHGRGSLNYVYKKGQTVRGEGLALRSTRSSRSDYRLAVVVSRKVSKSAVVRGRIRRRVYEIVRLNHLDAAKPWPHDMILTVFDASVATTQINTLKKIVSNLLQKAKITQTLE